MSDGDGRLVQPFPQPGGALKAAFDMLAELDGQVSRGMDPKVDSAALPKPWDPATITNTDMRMQLWTWLSQVVDWINHEYAWDVDEMIPACWPLHPHLVHDIAVLACQRRAAGLLFNSDHLQVWHQTTLTDFRARMRAQLQQHCDEGHAAWPARARHGRQTSIKAWQGGNSAFLADLRAVRGAPSEG